MMKIGEFARACGVNTQTLRYYDRIGLFPADYVDQDSDYRYYEPSRVHEFEMIVELKELGLSLEEIRHFLSSSESVRRQILSEKRKMLEARIQTEKERIHRIDAQESPFIKETHPRFSYLRIPFEDDPDVIGKWRLCGALSPSAKFKGESHLLSCDATLKELYFLPGGGHVWFYFWSRGVLYRLCGDGSKHTASPYHTFVYRGKRYLSLVHPEEATAHIYRQIDNAVYTEKQTYIYKDEVDLPFVPDEKLLGTWETVGVIPHPNDFSTLQDGDAEGFYIKEITFFERGVCRKLLKNSGSGYPLICFYTRGRIIDRERDIAEHYELCTKHGENYLIAEHKSADYAYLGKVFCYYVFKKRKDTTE